VKKKSLTEEMASEEGTGGSKGGTGGPGHVQCTDGKRVWGILQVGGQMRWGGQQERPRLSAT